MTAEITRDLCPPLGKRTVTALVPAQTGCGGLADALAAPGSTIYEVHLVRSCDGPTPGPFLCGLPRFGDQAPGWSLRGGVTGPRVVQQSCTGCVEAAVNDFPGLPVLDGVGAAELRAAIREEAHRG